MLHATIAIAMLLLNTTDAYLARTSNISGALADLKRRLMGNLGRKSGAHHYRRRRTTQVKPPYSTRKGNSLHRH